MSTLLINGLTGETKTANQENSVQTENTSTQKKPESMIEAIGVMKRIEQIAVEVSVWEMGAFAEANAILYTLIQKAYALHKELTDTKDVNLKYKKQGLNDYLALHGLSAYKDKPLTTKIIRALFGNRDRRRLSTYNVTLKFLVQNDFAVEDVPAKIAEFGGIQAISLGKPEGYLNAKKRAELANEEVRDTGLASFTSSSLKKKYNADKIGEQFAAVLTYESDGSFSVNCIVPSSTAVNATLTAFYNSVKKENSEEKKVEVVTKKQKNITEAVKNAIAA